MPEWRKCWGREILHLKVVHRSYLDEACVQVCIFDDRVEVLSPGMLYGGLDIATAKMGKSRCRNEAIAEAFHYMRIIESWGTGIPRLYNRSAEYGLREPLFEEFGDGIKVTMFRRVSSSTQKVGSTGEKVSSTSEKVSSGAQEVSSTFERYVPILKEAEITYKFIESIEKVFNVSGVDTIFGQTNVQEWLRCSKSKSTNVMKAMKTAKVIKKVSGVGFGKYQFIKL